MEKLLGFVGVPPKEVLDEFKELNPIDLDIPRADISINIAHSYLPKTFCATLRTVLANAITLAPYIEVFILEVGEGKCDGMRFVSQIIKELTGKRVIETRNENKKKYPTPISDSIMPLKRKIELITQTVITPIRKPLQTGEHSCGFWGVPPYDFSLLDLFPEDTLVLGWSRCMEAKVPADLQLETWVPEDLPVVFFAQQFCQKNALAEYLAHKYNGLYIEVDTRITTSIKAKIEAFLHFHGALK